MVLLAERHFLVRHGRERSGEWKGGTFAGDGASGVMLRLLTEVFAEYTVDYPKYWGHWWSQIVLCCFLKYITKRIE